MVKNHVMSFVHRIRHRHIFVAIIILLVLATLVGGIISTVADKIVLGLTLFGLGKDFGIA